MVTQSDEIFCAERREYFRNLLNEFRTQYSKDHVDALIRVIMYESPVQIVDPSIIILIKSLQANGTPVMALTALSTASFKNKHSFVDWRINELKDVGISFKNSWAHVQTKQFITFKVKHVPAFKEGVLFSSGEPKGEVLEVFLKDINFKRKKIIFVDDRRENLESMQQYCQKHGIGFLGFEYTAAAELSPQVFNETRAKLQVNVLEHELKWLSDAEAEHRLALTN